MFIVYPQETCLTHLKKDFRWNVEKPAKWDSFFFFFFFFFNTSGVHRNHSMCTEVMGWTTFHIFCCVIGQVSMPAAVSYWVIDNVIFFYHFHLDLMHNKCIALFVFWKMYFHLQTIPDPELFHWPDTTYHILESGLFRNDFVSFPCQVIRNLPVRFESAYKMMNGKGARGRTFIRCPGGKG